MSISSRTPEGVPGRCPVCSAEIQVEPSSLTGDAPCPRCGCLLWFVSIDREVRFYLPENISSRKREVIEALLQAHREGPVDSLDLVEMLIFLDEEFDLGVARDRLEGIQSLDELIDYIIRELPD